MRARLGKSKQPRRIFEMTVEAVKPPASSGRGVYSTPPLYDAEGAMDTVALMRPAMRGLLKAADVELEAELRAEVKRSDDYASSAKPQIDWDNQAARDGLVSSRARDAHACLALLEGGQLTPEAGAVAEPLAGVLGQDLEAANDGSFRIAHKVIKDRVISTVDPDVRHGHKTAARGFDGYRGHIALDPRQRDNDRLRGHCRQGGRRGRRSRCPALEPTWSPTQPMSPSCYTSALRPERVHRHD